jgi:hypothetical protein
MRFLIICAVLSCTAACEDRPPSAPSAFIPTDESTLRVTGTVVEIEAGGPIAEATITAVSACTHVVLTETATDGVGGFSLEFASALLRSGCNPGPLRASAVQLRAKKDGYVPNTVTLTAFGVGSTIRLQALRQVTGLVSEVDAGPVSGVTVAAGSSRVTYTDSNGSFVLEDVGTFLRLSKDGFVERDVAVPAGRAADLGTLFIQRAITLSGGSAVASRISSMDVAYDLTYLWGDPPALCSPCKWIDMQTGGRELDVRLQGSGSVPLQLWAGAYSPVVSLRAGPKAGESELTLRIPAATRFLLVGLPTDTNVPSRQPFPEPQAFALTAAPQEG